MKKNLWFLTFLFTLLLMMSTLNGKDENKKQGNSLHLQQLTMQLPAEQKIFEEELLPGEITETKVIHVILAPGQKTQEKNDNTFDPIFLFIKGKGQFVAADQRFEIDPECIAFSPRYNVLQIVAADQDTLHYIKILKTLSNQDFEDIKEFPAANRSKVYFKRFADCQAYTEKIKSPNTVSRTVLPKDFVPRVSMGTVEAPGPDQVGAHKHPMLDQLFLGLNENDVRVFADADSIHFPAFSLLHIPLGSMHWVKVAAGKKMYYMWMDFFRSKEGEEWLKTHKPVQNSKK